MNNKLYFLEFLRPLSRNVIWSSSSFEFIIISLFWSFLVSNCLLSVTASSLNQFNDRYNELILLSLEIWNSFSDNSFFNDMISFCTFNIWPYRYNLKKTYSIGCKKIYLLFLHYTIHKWVKMFNLIMELVVNVLYSFWSWHILHHYEHFLVVFQTVLVLHWWCQIS